MSKDIIKARDIIRNITIGIIVMVIIVLILSNLHYHKYKGEIIKNDINEITIIDYNKYKIIYDNKNNNKYLAIPNCGIVKLEESRGES